MLELTILIPCLNEEDTIGKCINKAKTSMKKNKIKGEILIIDNGSTDNSIKISRRLGARVILETKHKGYGIALRKGIINAKGKYIIMGDADDSYDFSIINKFYKKLVNGYDFVQGCRFPSGGGRIKKNAMPFSHQYFGNPFFSYLLKFLFKIPFNDVYCGMRGFKKSIALKHNYICKGMQFAIENLLKFHLTSKKVTEIPIILHKDGRKQHSGHLKTVSDGIKTLKLILLLSPTWFYFIFQAFLFLLFFNDLTNSFQNELGFNNLISKHLLFISISLQLFFLWVYSRLTSINLGFSKEGNFLKLFFKFFKIEYLILFLVILLFVVFFLNQYSINLNFIILVSIITFNSLIVSLTELLKNKQY